MTFKIILGKCMNNLRKRGWHGHTPMQCDIAPAQRAIYEPGTPHVLLAIIEWSRMV